MSTFTYPPLRVAVLRGLLSLKERFDENPDFLRGGDVPYDNESIEILEKILTVKVVEKVVEKIVQGKVSGGKGRPKRDDALNAADNAEMEQMVKDLLENLKNMDETKEGLEVSERVQITKTKAALVEQLLKARERIFNVKRHSEFQSTVISILDDIVDEAGRDVFLARIEPFTE